MSGTYPHRVIDMAGQSVGNLTVIERVRESEGGKAKWRCLCGCGKETVVTGDRLRRGRTKSCGCWKGRHRDAIFPGRKYRPEYSVWLSMKKRCSNARAHDYSRYGGRGIVVCERWRDSFDAFYADMGQRPSPKHSIDRINNDGNYEPGNCRWATAYEQAANSRGYIDGTSRLTRGELLALVRAERVKHSALLDEVEALRTGHARLRRALVALVGVDTIEELDAMEAFVRAAPAPAEDKAETIDAIHALKAVRP
jgi:hypothetical protein